MNYEELEEKIDKILLEVDELLRNDIPTLESTGSFLFQLGMFDDPQDEAHYKAMLKHIDEAKNEK